MAKPPILKPREVVALLQRLGFREVRQRGSHKQFRHTDGRVTTVPVHAGETFHRLSYAGLPATLGSRFKNFLTPDSQRTNKRLKLTGATKWGRIAFVRQVSCGYRISLWGACVLGASLSAIR